MKKFPTILKSKIDGIDHHLLTVVYCDDGEKKTWEIQDNKGHMTPTFDNNFYPYVYNDHSFVCLGSQNGSKNIYKIDAFKDKFCSRVDVEGGLIDIRPAGHDTFLVTTSKGMFLLDKSTLTRKSDFFDYLSYDNGRFPFEKHIKYFNQEYIYCGEVTSNGQIRPFLYDFHNDTFMSTPYGSSPSNDYEVIDDSTLVQRIYLDECSKYRHRDISMNTLRKLNGDYSRR